MKIAHTVFSVASNSGGIGPVVSGITQSLASIESVEPTTYVPTSGYDKDFPTRIKQFAGLGPGQHCLCPGLTRQIADDQNELIHTHGIWTFLARTNRSWNKAGKPYLISPHGMTMPAAMKYARWKKALFWPLLEKKNLGNAACLHALSSIEAKSIRALGIKTPIVKIGNGVDLPVLASNQDSNATANDGVRTLLYLGRLHPIKSVDKLIAAWRSANVNQPGKDPWRLQIVGWGQDDYVTSLKKLALDESSIVFSGPLFGEDKDRAMNQASGFILPSSSEAFPMALMEAWSHALPAVATKTCNVLGAAGSSVSMFVDGTEDAISAGIQSITTMTDQQRQTMGDAARAIVAKDYSWEQIAQNLLACYHWILDSGPEPTHLMYD